MKVENIYSAYCLCQGIKIKIIGKLGGIENCYCSQCMKTHGNFGPYTSCNENKLTSISKKVL